MLLVGNSRGGGAFEVTGADSRSTWVSDLRGKACVNATEEEVRVPQGHLSVFRGAAILASVPGQAGVT